MARRIGMLIGAVTAFALSGCVTPPPDAGPPIEVGACFDDGRGFASFRYDGPADTFENSSIFGPGCDGPVSFLATVVFAGDADAALATCTRLGEGFGSTENLATSGWVASGSTTSIDVRVWGCGPPL